MAEASSTLTVHLQGRDDGATTALHGFGAELQSLGRLALGFATGNILATLTMGLEERIKGAVEAVQTLGMSTLQLQRVIGGSAEDVSGMIALFQRYGITVEQAQLRLTLFSKAVTEASTAGGKTGPGAQQLEKLNIGTRTDTGQLRSTLDILKDVAEAVKNIPAMERTTALRDLFGRGAAQLAPLFTQGAAGIATFIEEAQKMGLVINQDTVGQAFALSKAHHELDMALQGVSVTLGALMLPGLLALVQTINSQVIPVIVAVPEHLQQVVTTAQTLATEFPIASGLITAAILSTMVPAFIALATAAWAAATGIITAIAPVVLLVGGLIILGVLLQKAWETNFMGVQQIVADTINNLLANWQIALGFVLPFINAPLLIQKAWESNFLGIQGIVQTVVNFIGDKISGLMDFLGEHGLLGVTANWREGWDQLKTQAVAGVMGAVNAAGQGLDFMAGKAGEVGKAVLGHVTSTWNAAGQTIKDAMKPGGEGGGEAAEKELTATQELAGMKAQQKTLEAQLLEMAGKRAQIEESAVLAREKLLGLSAQNAASDLSYEEKRLRLKIQSDALAGRGVSAADISQLTSIALNKPAVELAALEAGRPLQLAQQTKEAADLGRTIAQAPLQASLADVQAEITRKQAEIDELKAHKAEGSSETTNNVTINQQIDNGAGHSGEDLVQKTIDAVFGVLNQIQGKTPTPAPAMLPGARGPGLPS